MIHAVVFGNIGKAPELKFVGDGGQAVLSFSVASRSYGKQDDGSMGDVTTWVRVTMWGKRAESISKHLDKGSRVVVSGTMTQRAWDSNGKSGVDLELRATEIEFAGSKPSGESAGASNGAKPQPPRTNGQQSRPQPAPAPQSDIPFGTDGLGNGYDDEITY